MEWDFIVSSLLDSTLDVVRLEMDSAREARHTVGTLYLAVCMSAITGCGECGRGLGMGGTREEREEWVTTLV